MKHMSENKTDLFWNSMNLFLLTEFCVNKEAPWLLGSQLGCKTLPTVMVWSILFLTYSLHPLPGPAYHQGWLLAFWPVRKAGRQSRKSHTDMCFLSVYLS